MKNKYISKKKLIRKLAEELAYLQISADWWMYVFPYDLVDNENENANKKQEMAKKEMEAVYELCCVCSSFRVLKEVYDEAYKIYDFRGSGKKDYKPDLELIKRLNKEFCEPRQHKRPFS